MTFDRTPPNPPDVPERKSASCAAFGCPMWASIKVGPEWVCDCHASGEGADWQAITKRLRENLPLLRAAHRAMHLDVHAVPDWCARATEHMAKIGYPELAPGERKARRRITDPITHQVLEYEVVLDEIRNPRLWAIRVRSALSRIAAVDQLSLLEGDDHATA